MDVILLVLRVLIALALYALVGVILIVLLRERRPLPAQLPPRAWLVRLNADGTPAAPQTLGPSTWIGRDPNCAIRVKDEFASARHAHVEWQAVEQAWWITDNASRNGTRVNDKRVMRCELAHGDRISIGDAQFRFEEDGRLTTNGA
jgi:hypothetical protein